MTKTKIASEIRDIFADKSRPRIGVALAESSFCADGRERRRVSSKNQRNRP